MLKKLISFFCVLLPIAFSQQYNDEFHEEMYIKFLPSTHVNAFFQFTTKWKLDSNDSLYHTNLMPRSIAEMFLQFNIREFHVSLTQGLWRYETWGYPPIDSPPGAEIWAWFNGNLTNDEINLQWKNLCGTLSGILCASLNFVDSTNSVEPKYSFRPQFGISNGGYDSSHIRYATLPREIVCTENLTPWKKLLPCSSRNGFSSLLNSGYVHNTNYHSLNLEARTFCPSTNINECTIILKETANLVYDGKLFSSDSSLRKLFGQGLNGACALAKTSKIYIDITDDKYEITPPPTNIVNSKHGGTTTVFAEYDVQTKPFNRLFNIAWALKQQQNVIPIIPLPPIYAHRYIFGHGQEKGKIVTQIINTHYDALNIIVQENIPWYVPCYLHTLVVKVNDIIIQPKIVHFIPGQQREKPYHLEIAFTIPAKSKAAISFDFDYIFLKWLEYPPDANHGHYLGSAVISTVLSTARNYTAIPIEGIIYADSFNATSIGYFLQIRTESLLLSLPTPDFSMPYNVICLACTVVALAFGPIHSVATKRIIAESTDSPQSLFGKLKQRLFKKKPKTKNISETAETILHEKTE